MSLFPKDDKQRKSLPIFQMIAGYFPKALREVTRVCVANNVRYNPGREPADINWARGKSKDQLGSAFRHMLEYKVDELVFEETSPEIIAACGIEKVYTLAEAAWRLLAALELEIEAQECKVPLPKLSVPVGTQVVDFPDVQECELYFCTDAAIPGSKFCRKHTEHV